MVCVFVDAKIFQMYMCVWEYEYGLTLEKRPLMER